MAETTTIPDTDLYDARLVTTLNTFVSSGSCVLLLGPLFGVDNGNRKIHVALKALLTGPPNNLKLDDEFDNLYISKSADGPAPDLKAGILNYYQDLQRNPIYDKIIDIGFRAIINFTSDLLLADANTAAADPYDFYSFSSKSKEPLNDQSQPALSKRPVLYNIFGNINDLNSLITDYDSLYDFLINMLKADQEFPLQLKNILSNAVAFVFLGFDLSKWYIPLLVRKLNQFILNGTRAKNAILAFACLDDTPAVPPEAVTDSINKYPLIFKPFKQLNSVALIESLAAQPKRAVKLNGAEPHALTAAERAFFNNWDSHLKDYSSTEGLQAFFQAYKAQGYSGAQKKEFDLLSMQYNELVSQKMAIRITDEAFAVGCNNLITSVLNYIAKLL